jgi:hypothetical protein
MKEVNAPKCGRENDLIGFLYDELDDVEAQSFQRHVRDCASCNAELAAFRDVRGAVVTWRNESIGVISSPITEMEAASVGHQKPSALAAVRAFFNLAPLWTKGAVAFASALFVLFAVLAIARWHTGRPLEATPTPVVIHKSPDNAYSPEQLNALVEQRVQEELQRLKSSTEKASPSPGIIAGTNQSPRGRVLNNTNESASNQKLRRPLSKTEREQLASDLRLISDKPENEFDLLGDRINQ